MNTLVKIVSPQYISETIEHGAHKFKIVCKNGNSYCQLEVYLYTLEGLKLIATLQDIQGAKHIDYDASDMERIALGERNISAAENYLKSIYK